jgi:hypothetical protein
MPPKSKEQILQEALERVRAMKPQNLELVALARKGKLKFNVSSVAQEAGVSRTLIGMEGCRYPKIRVQIIEAKIPVRKRTDVRTINADLRAINRELERRLNLSLAERAAMVVRVQKTETAYLAKVDDLKRIRARGVGDPNQVAGSNVTRIKKD